MSNIKIGIFSVCIFLLPYAFLLAQTGPDTQAVSTVAYDVAFLKQRQQELDMSLKIAVEKSISNHISAISKTVREQPGRIEQINKFVNPKRLELLQNISTALSSSELPSEAIYIDLQQETIQELTALHESLASMTGVHDYSKEYQSSIAAIINQAIVDTSARIAKLKENKGDLVYLDSDADGYSDFDEITVYKTDPIRKNTSLVPKHYQDPHTEGQTVENTFSVTNISYASDTQDGQVVVEGTALPNSTITVFIYSNPIIAQVKANAQGIWKYFVVEPFDNGNHTVYVASVNGEGTIVAKSEPVKVAKTSKSIVFEKIGITDDVIEQRKERFVANIIPIIIGVIGIAALFIGILYRMIKKSPL